MPAPTLNMMIRWRVFTFTTGVARHLLPGTICARTSYERSQPPRGRSRSAAPPPESPFGIRRRRILIAASLGLPVAIDSCGSLARCLPVADGLLAPACGDCRSRGGRGRGRRLDRAPDARGPGRGGSARARSGGQVSGARGEHSGHRVDGGCAAQRPVHQLGGREDARVYGRGRRSTRRQADLDRIPASRRRTPREGSVRSLVPQAGTLQRGVSRPSEGRAVDLGSQSLDHHLRPGRRPLRGWPDVGHQRPQASGGGSPGQGGRVSEAGQQPTRRDLELQHRRPDHVPEPQRRAHLRLHRGGVLRAGRGAVAGPDPFGGFRTSLGGACEPFSRTIRPSTRSTGSSAGTASGCGSTTARSGHT